MGDSVFSTSPALPLVQAKIGEFIFGFGKKNLSMQMLSEAYPAVAWEHLKQIHSAKIVESFKPSDEKSSVGACVVVEADSHFTSVANLGLVVKSADCVPVLIACAATDQPPAICAIHAGWRGVNTDIVQISVKKLLSRHYAPTRMIAMIGPHIRRQSFEVGFNVARDLMMTAKRAGVTDPQSVITTHPTDHTKRFVDLEIIVRHQLMSLAIPGLQIHSLLIDTLTTDEWSSFRRNGANAGRNLSFIAIVGKD